MVRVRKVAEEELHHLVANYLQHTELVINRIREKTDTVILFYSCGKDSMVLLDICSKKFKKVICIYMYMVKDLKHINKFIRFSEKRYFNAEFHQIPHYGLSTLLKLGIFCKSNTNITKRTTLADIDEAVRLKFKCKWSLYGWKQSDGMNRCLTLRSYELEAISKTQKGYPLSKWKKADVLLYLKRNRLPEPIAY